MTEPKERRKKLYDALIKQNAFSGSEEDFNSKFSDKERISKLYDGLQQSGGIQSTSPDEFQEKFFGDIVKKKSVLTSFAEQASAGLDDHSKVSGQFGGTESVPAAEKKSDIFRTGGWQGLRSDIEKNRKESVAKDKEAQEQKKQKLADYYDKISPTLDTNPEEGIKMAYKNWTAENDGLDRYDYLAQKAQHEASLKREDLGNAVKLIKQYQEERRQAAISGNMEEYSRLNDMVQKGAEYLRLNKQAASNDYKADPRTETGLKLWEEAVGFNSEMLNAKMDKALADPETAQKITRLYSLNEQLSHSDNPELIKEYQNILLDPSVAEVNKIAKHGENIVNTEKDLAVKFPDIFQKRLEKKQKQDAVDAVFSSLDTASGLNMGVTNQVGRSAVGLIADIAKLPTLVDYNNQYGPLDKYGDAIDHMTEVFSDDVLPIPSDYNKPLYYEDEKGNSVFRKDLILPKTARVAGDMAALLFGAGKVSALAKVAGLSTKVSAGIGLFTSSYVQSYGDYKKSGVDAGMSPQDASLFATAAAGTTSALELISPNKYLWNPEDLAQGVVKNVAAGMTRKAAVKETLKTIGKEIGGENIQELTQQIGDLAVEKGAGLLAGNDYFKHNSKDVISEAIETMVLTTIVAGAPATGVSISHFANRDKNYQDAIHIVAENKDKYLPLLQKTFADADPEQVKQVMADINAVAVPQSGAPLYKIDGQTVERAAIEDKIKEGNLTGVYVANDKALESQLKQFSDNLIAPGTTVELSPKPEVKLPPAPKTEDGKPEDPEDKAKRVAKAQINELVKTGDLKYDGKRVTVLTEKGGHEFASIKDELDRSLSGGVHVSETKQKGEQAEQTNSSTTEQTNLSPEDTTQTAVKEKPLLEGDNLDLTEFTKTATEPETKRVGEVLTKAKKALTTLKPGLRMAIYKGSKQGNELLKSLGVKEKVTASLSGFYNRDTGVIGIDLSSAGSNTAFHEAFHPIIDAIKTEKPELFSKLSEEAGNSKLELEDGTVISYKDYTKGDTEESLVEFLADFADDKFDTFNNNKSLTQKVKDIINTILESVGLKAKDFDVDLDKVDNLKDFADQMAEAISKGKTINFSKRIAAKAKGTSFQNIGPKKKIREYEKKSGKKVNKTAKRIAVDKLTEFKDVAVSVVTNPDQYAYDPQKFSDIEALLDSKTDIELYDMLKINNSLAVLAGIKLFRRYNNNNKDPKKPFQDTKPIFKKLREIGTSVGQLLRQFGELKTNTPEGIVDIVLKNLESMNLELKDQQVKDLTALAEEHIKALEDKEAKRIVFTNNPSTQTDSDLKAAEKKLEETFKNLNIFIGKVTPLGVDSMAATILQGNLLTTKSIGANVVGNIIQQPFRQAELIAGDIATYVVNRMQGKVVTINPAELYWSATLNGIQQSALGFPKAIKDAVTGQNAETNSSLEVRRNLKPAQALWQLFTQAGRETLPVGANGKTPKSIYIEKFMEGTAGWTAEAFFRMLYATDKPFKDGAKAAGAMRLFVDSAGGKSMKDFRKFMANLTVEQKKKIEDYAGDATFSNERTGAKAANMFMKTLANWVDLAAEKTPNESMAYAMKALGKTLIKANIPFVQVPSNLLQYLVELAAPPVALWGSYIYAKRGDVRKSAQLFTRAFMGVGLYYLGNMLYDAGIVIASGGDDDDNERQLKHEVARPNSINVSALKRLMAGDDPTFQEGDDIRDITKLGELGLFLAYNAEWNEMIKKDQKKTRSEVSMVDQMSQAFGSITKTSLEMSFLQGSFTALDALRKGDFTNYFTELANTYSAIIIPNQYAATFTRPRADYILRADDKSTLSKLAEKESIKIFPNMNNNIAGVYPIIGMFGDPVAQTPAGKNSMIYHLFDITNSEHITDPMALEVYNLSKKTGEIPISLPEPEVRLDEVRYTLNEQDYTYLQMLAGQYKKFDLGFEMSQPEWKTMTDVEKNEVIQDINKDANSDAREQVIDRLYDGIDSGRIVLDEIMGTYKYTSPSEFDFDYAKKQLEEDTKQ